MPANLDASLTISTEIVVFALSRGELGVLLAHQPNALASLPVGQLHPNETIEDCAKREAVNVTGFEGALPIQFAIYSDPRRDPNGRVVSIAHFACGRIGLGQIDRQIDSRKIKWYSLQKVPTLALDHGSILLDAVRALRQLAAILPVAAILLEQPFTLSELQGATEAVLGEAVDKRNFRRQVLEGAWLVEAEGKSGGRHRPAQLYSFNSMKKIEHLILRANLM